MISLTPPRGGEVAVVFSFRQGKNSAVFSHHSSEATAVPQLLHPEAIGIAWYFPQENATLPGVGMGT
jgi:hypothetical protein